MSFINSYKPSSPPRITETVDGPYDLNFAGPIPEKLETDRVRLVPFIPHIHAKIFHSIYVRFPEVEKYLPISWQDYSEFLTTLEYFIRADSGSLLFAIIDRTKGNDGANLEESLAGMIGYLHASPANLAVEIGPVIVLPPFQKTFVASHAIGLVLNNALNLPSEGGMGYRRVAWSANPNNEGSVRVAQRMGFTIEGVHRWAWVMSPDRDGGKPPVDGKRGAGQGRDSVVLSLCFDDWDKGGRELVAAALNRP